MIVYIYIYIYIYICNNHGNTHAHLYVHIHAYDDLATDKMQSSIEKLPTSSTHQRPNDSCCNATWLFETTVPRDRRCGMITAVRQRSP
jgi:hypothetical protein